MKIIINFNNFGGGAYNSLGQGIYSVFGGKNA